MSDFFKALSLLWINAWFVTTSFLYFQWFVVLFMGTGVFDTFLKFKELSFDMNTSTNRMNCWSFGLRIWADETTYNECKCCKISRRESLYSLGLWAKIFQKVMDDVESWVFAQRAGQEGKLEESASHQIWTLKFRGQLRCTGHDISREQSYIVTDLGKIV